MPHHFDDLDTILNSDQLITTDRYLAHCSDCESCRYFKSDLIYRGARWRDSWQASPLARRAGKDSETAVLGHSDHSITSTDVLALWSFGHRNIWGVNMRASQPYAHALPLGLTNFTSESPLHAIFGDPDHLKKAADSTNFLDFFDGSIYSNFSANTFPKERRPLQQLLDQMGVVNSPTNMTAKGRITYLQNLRSHSLVVCPRGNGIDTHRLWETLYMGGTPIVLRDRAITPLVSELPVIVLDNWGQLSEKVKLEGMWHELNNQSFRFEKLTSKFWIEQFCKSNL